MHLADLHLDSRFAGSDPSESAKKRSELRNVLTGAFDVAKTEGCDAVLISGDLFDSEYYTKDTLDFLRGAFASMPDVRFFIAPGNHDPYNSSSPYRLGVFPENVTVFDSENVTCVEIDELDLAVYGYAFTSSVYRNDPLEGFKRTDCKGFAVLCAHTELDATVTPYAPITTERLCSSGFDYAALGHVHDQTGIREQNGTVYAYSGCLAGRDHTENGEKGGIIVTLDKENGENNVKAKFVRLCPWVWTTLSVNVSGASDEKTVTDIVEIRLKELQSVSETNTIIKLRLTGEIKCDVNEENVKISLSSYGVDEVHNETVSTCGFDELENDISLRGEFYRVLLSELKSEDPERRRIARMALRYGLNALNGAETDV